MRPRASHSRARGAGAAHSSSRAPLPPPSPGRRMADALELTPDQLGRLCQHAFAHARVVYEDDNFSLRLYTLFIVVIAVIVWELVRGAALEIAVAARAAAGALGRRLCVCRARRPSHGGRRAA